VIVLNKGGRYGSDEYLVCPPHPATLSTLRGLMLDRAKVTDGSYAYRLIEDLFADIFVRSLDLKADYRSYFAIEYSTFAEFLRRRSRFANAVIAQLVNLVDHSIGVYHYRPSYPFLTDLDGQAFLLKLLNESSGGAST
jgi:hypothetical protein